MKYIMGFTDQQGITREVDVRDLTLQNFQELTGKRFRMRSKQRRALNIPPDFPTPPDQRQAAFDQWKRETLEQLENTPEVINVAQLSRKKETANA